MDDLKPPPRRTALRIVRRVVGGFFVVVWLLLTARVAQLGLMNWEQPELEAMGLEPWQIEDSLAMYHLRCHTGMVVFPLLAVISAGIGFGLRFMTRFALVVLPLAAVVMFAFGRIILR